MFCVLVALTVGPFTWMNSLSEIQNRKWSSICLRCLPVLALLLTFGSHFGFWSNSQTMFSNDGSFGYMQSAHARLASPGGDSWNDLWWLGSPGGSYPITISYILIWFGYHPDALVCLLVFSALAYGLVRRHQRRNPKKPGQPVCHCCGQTATVSIVTSSDPRSHRTPMCQRCFDLRVLSERWAGFKGKKWFDRK